MSFDMFLDALEEIASECDPERLVTMLAQTSLVVDAIDRRLGELAKREKPIEQRLSEPLSIQ